MSNDVPTHDKLGFPVVPCSRCCGTGILTAFRNVQGGECFKCGGTGVFVKPGKAAKARAAYVEAVKAAQSKPWSEVKVGEVVLAGRAWRTVVDIREDKLNAGRIIVTLKNGDRIGTDPAFSARMRDAEVPDVADYLKGL
jgi:hypothetical protein